MRNLVFLALSSCLWIGKTDYEFRTECVKSSVIDTYAPGTPLVPGTKGLTWKNLFRCTSESTYTCSPTLVANTITLSPGFQYFDKYYTTLFVTQDGRIWFEPTNSADDKIEESDSDDYGVIPNPDDELTGWIAVLYSPSDRFLVRLWDGDTDGESWPEATQLLIPPSDSTGYSLPSCSGGVHQDGVDPEIFESAVCHASNKNKHFILFENVGIANRQNEGAAGEIAQHWQAAQYATVLVELELGKEGSPGTVRMWFGPTPNREINGDDGPVIGGAGVVVGMESPDGYRGMCTPSETEGLYLHNLNRISNQALEFRPPTYEEYVGGNSGE